MKTFNWRPWSKHYRQTLLPIVSRHIGNDQFHLMKHNDTYYLMKPGIVNVGTGIVNVGTGITGEAGIVNETTAMVARIPLYMAASLMHMDNIAGQVYRDTVTYWIGPYGFLNNFEDTTEGKYLIEMLQYMHLSNAAQHKVDKILAENGYWVQLDKDMLHIMQAWRSQCSSGGHSDQR